MAFQSFLFAITLVFLPIAVYSIKPAFIPSFRKIPTSTLLTTFEPHGGHAGELLFRNNNSTQNLGVELPSMAKPAARSYGFKTASNQLIAMRALADVSIPDNGEVNWPLYADPSEDFLVKNVELKLRYRIYYFVGTCTVCTYSLWTCVSNREVHL